MSKVGKPVFAGLSEQQLHTLLELISDGVWDWNANTGYVYRNPGWYNMLGYPCHSLANNVHTWENVIHPDDYSRVMAHFEDCLNQKCEIYQIEYRCRCQDGSYIWVEDRAQIIVRNEDGTVARMLGAHRNIDANRRLTSELKKEKQTIEMIVDERTYALSELNKQLRQQVYENQEMAERDALTKAANRYRLEKTLHEEFKRAQRFFHSLSLIVLDIDDFKLINDVYGHAQGDNVLVMIVSHIRNYLRPHDLLARWGGDEFIIVMPHTTKEEAVGVAMNIQLALAHIHIEPGDIKKLTISYGVVELEKGEEPDDLLKRGDQVLYQAKRSGKNTILTK
ncbi:diguanylate cyclase [Phytobacter sp. RSE-02]|uniref:sensor domain-containing diguanylate cyclase n=1 Tax=Phytobacter sp. RSE-02 TaxID=3229229 RepID=UPI00339D54FE